MHEILQLQRHGRRSVLGIAGTSLMATALIGGVAAAQDAQPAPQGGATVTGGGVAQGGPGVVQVGPGVPAGPGVVQVGPDGCVSWQTVTVGPDGTTQQGGGDTTCAQGGPMPVGPMGPGDVVINGVGPGMPGSVGVVADPAQLVTVTAVNGSTVSLVTKDGWTRDVDTTNVVITLDAATLTAADLAVGDTVQVDQTRNANDTYTITGLEIVLPQVAGVVGTVGTDSFTLTGMDGATTTVHVSSTTKWPAQMPGQGATALTTLKAGDYVVAQGKLETDGSMDATSITTGGLTVITGVSRSGMGAPDVTVAPAIPAPAASPAPSPKG